MNNLNTTRFAAIADIHGNSDALTAVLEDIDRLGISEIVNLGDHLSGPVAARETADIIISRDMTCIRGNHDRWLVEQKIEEMGAADVAAINQLDENHLVWLRSLKPTLALNEDVFLCHGTPSSDTTYWLESVSADGSVGLRNYQEIENEAADLSFSLILCGHTHIPRAVRLRDGRLIVNPGSVGCPGYRDDQPYPHVMQSGTPDACYTVLEKRDSRWYATFKFIPYNTDRMVAAAQDQGNKQWAQRLATGWVEIE